MAFSLHCGRLSCGHANRNHALSGCCCLSPSSQASEWVSELKCTSFCNSSGSAFSACTFQSTTSPSVVRSSLINTGWAYCMPYHAMPQDGLQGVGVAMWWGKVRWGTACSIGKQGPQPQYLPSQTKLFIPIYFLFIVVYTSQLSAKGHL